MNVGIRWGDAEMQITYRSEFLIEYSEAYTLETLYIAR